MTSSKAKTTTAWPWLATLDFSGETKGISDAIMANHNIGELRS